MFYKDKGYLIESAFHYRPGSFVDVKLRITTQTIIEWDGSAYSTTIDGFAHVYSILQDTTRVAPDITQVYDTVTDTTAIDITALDAGDYDITINSVYTSNQYDVPVYSSLDYSMSDEYNLDNYLYIDHMDGVAVPRALVNINDLIADPISISDVESAEIVTTSEQRGICRLFDTILRINDNGNMNDINVLKKGIENVWVSSKYAGKYLEFKDNKKLISIDNQALSVPGIKFFGIELVGEVLFIMTSNGLYGFDKYSNFITPIDSPTLFHWPTILGTDITYTHDDCLAIASGDTIIKYPLRHDFVFEDRLTNKIYFREEYTDSTYPIIE